MEELEASGSKKPSLVMTIAVVAILSLVAGGGGWGLGQMIAPPPADAAVKAEEANAAAAGAHGEPGAKGEEQGLARISTEQNGVVQLEPITSNLSYPSETGSGSMLRCFSTAYRMSSWPNRSTRTSSPILEPSPFSRSRVPAGSSISRMTSRSGLTFALKDA